MHKEILIGLALGICIFMAILGVNVTPFILLTLFLGGGYYFLLTQGKLSYSSFGNRNKAGERLKFEDIGGQDSAINELKEALQFLIKPDKMDSLGIRPLKGVLLVGPPGTGKTLMARAAAGYTNAAFLSASGSEFIEMYAGVGAKRIRRLFNDARKKASALPGKSAIIFIDELEILGAKRGNNSGHMEYDQTLNQLLVEMDGIMMDDDTQILIIGATNRADILDSALVRPGRFDRMVQVSLPDRAGRRRILAIHTENKPLKDNAVLDEVARATFGLSGAHLESLANEAAILAMRESCDIIETRHFTEAIDKVLLGEKNERKPSAIETARVCIHEAGHALVSELLEPGSVSSFTIIPRGGALGFMRKSARDDQYLFTLPELENQIKVTLGGAIAEQIKFSNRSTGASNDFMQAWRIAREIIESGLSSLGIVFIDDIPTQVLYDECKNIIKRLEEQTMQLLKYNYILLERIADTIFEEETIDQQRFQQLLAG
ncbi:MAG: AAA family ATPase [Syntrophomonadaceae bacterium]|nr:AAA family ATPase [Syntrophomonadaceae bacterium]